MRMHVSVWRVTYRDGSHELFARSLRKFEAGDELMFVDERGRKYVRDRRTILRIEETQQMIGQEAA